MRIERGDLADAGMIRACHEVYDAALRADKAEGPWLSAERFSGWLTVGWVGDPREVWLVTDQAAVGAAESGEARESGGAAGGAREDGRATGAVGGWYRYMIAVNQAIGYEPPGPPNTFWRLDVPRALG